MTARRVAISLEAGAPAHPRTSVGLLDADADLGAALTGAEAALAGPRLVVPVVAVGVGTWHPAVARHGVIAMLVVEGVLMRAVHRHQLTEVQLVGPGEYIDPRLLLDDVRWQVLARAELAVLDEQVATVSRQCPALLPALVARVFAGQRAQQRIAAVRCYSRVEDRLEQLMADIARQWGRVTTDGLVVDLAITHAELGMLVGARRPTVSLALKKLHEQGDLVRVGRGRWLLPRALSQEGIS